MPRVIEELHGFERYAWTTTAYLLTSTTAVPIFGKLSDMYGRKPYLLGGAIFFVLTSALCGAAGDIPLPIDGMNQLILFRGLQGIGAGIITALIFTVIGDIFSPAERGKYQGLFSAVWGLASVFGPTLGGWITDQLSWRWVFYVNLPVGLVAALVLYFSFPNIRPPRIERKVDYWGVITLIACVVPLLLALTWAGELHHGWSAPRVIIALSIAAVMLLMFLWVESQALEPILPLSLFRKPIFTVSMVSLFMTGMGMFAAVLFIPLFMQAVIGVSATQSGTLLTPMMLTMMTGSILSGQLVSRTGRYKILAFIGFGIMLIGLYLLSQMTIDATRSLTVRNMLFVGFGVGLTMPLFTLVVQNAVSPMQMGVATAATQFFRSMGATMGTAIFGTIMLREYTSKFTATVPAGIPDELRSQFTNPLQLIHNLPALQEQYRHIPNGPALLETLLHTMKDALVFGLNDVFFLATIVVTIAFGVTIFLKEIPLRKSHKLDTLEARSEAPAPEGAYATGRTANAHQVAVAIVEEGEGQQSLFPL
jgi:EmrB/QacA subfamily drug resistance transporter